VPAPALVRSHHANLGHFVAISNRRVHAASGLLSSLATCYRSRVSPLEVVQASPAAVKLHDKLRWLSLFTPDVHLEDPVGAGEHVGLHALSSFWDVFIQPNHVTFHSKKDFVRGDRVVRFVEISTVTPIDRAAFALDAIIEYRVEDDRISVLRAYWEPRHAVVWHAQKGLRGLSGLMKHGTRMTFGLGLGAAMGFGKALRPNADRGLGDKLVRAIGDRDAWRSLTSGVTELDVDPSIETAPSMRPEAIIAAGDHVACVASSGDRWAAIIARARGSRIQAVRALSA
jgi:hypothetical protein